MITLAQVKKLNKKSNVIPVFRRISADLDTPVSAFIKLAAAKKDSFLLESVDGGEKLARYSFLGLEPFLIIESNGHNVTLQQGTTRKKTLASPIEFLKGLFEIYEPAPVAGLPRFTGGAVGYFSYDTIRLMERIPDVNPDEIGLPDMRFGLFSRIVVFDHLKQEIIVIANILHDQGKDGLEAKYEAAVAAVDLYVKKLQATRRPPADKVTEISRITPHYDKAEFEKLVVRAKRYIKEGDIFQVVLSQRWHIDTDRSALSVYRRLRRINPSPYMFMLNFGQTSLIGASPEMMVRVEKGNIEMRPIAGTCPRGKDEQEDEKLIRNLLADPKELAEHTMLLDLGRNDVGRVSRPGTVQLKDHMIIEKYSHVSHIVSSVVGKLKANTVPLDGHLACFPAGTVSGAPKIRAMEIIDELEKERRGVYAGSICYMDFWGNLDSCIAIRTVVKKGRRYYIQAGAGIVADSKPAREFLETEAKAHALISAVRGDDDE